MALTILQCKEMWNCRYIRKSQYSDISGRPDYLFYFPLRGFQNQGMQYSVIDTNHVKTVLFDTPDNEIEINGIFEEYFHLITSRLNLEKPNDFSGLNIFETFFENIQRVNIQTRTF